MNLKFLFLFLAVMTIVCPGRLYAQADPVAAKLNVAGEIRIGADNSLRLRPVVGAAPSFPEIGDLWFSGTTLSTCISVGPPVWQAFVEAGTLIYSDTTNTLFFHNGTSWINLGGAGGSRTVGTRIVAASNSLDTSRADYVCGATNAQTTIQQAITDLGVTGGAVYLLEGTYNISASINLASRVSLIGAGEMTVLQAASGVTGFNILSAVGVDSLLISQLRVDGNGGTGGNNGISFNSVTDSRIEKVWVESTRLCGIVFSAANRNLISNCNIPFNLGWGIELISTSNQNIISGNHLQDNSDGGINLSSSANNIIQANNILSPGGQGIVSSLSPNNIISENNIQSTANEGIRVASANNVILGNNIQDSGGEGIAVSSGSSNLISGNNLQNPGLNGLSLTSSQYNLLSGNVLLKTIVGAWDGIRFASDADSNLISSNYLSDSVGSGYGINILDTSSQGNYLSTNFIFDEYPGSGGGYLGSTFDRRIRDQGTSTTYTDKQKMTLERRQVNISSSPYLLWEMVVSPQSYIALNPSLATIVTLLNGKSAGDMLVLENISAIFTNTATINDSGNINLGANRVLGQYDTLELIWNGSKWIEVRYTKKN